MAMLGEDKDNSYERANRVVLAEVGRGLSPWLQVRRGVGAATRHWRRMGTLG
jgi:hypothetical protein